MAGKPILELSDVVSGYGKVMVLDAFTMHAERGEVLAVMGRNGVGKTTMLRTVMGQLPSSSGEIHFDGKPLSSLPPHARARLGIGYVPQGRRIFKTLSVRDNIRVAAHGVGTRNWSAAVERMYALFPVLADKSTQPGGQLSGGQQQILALAGRRTR